MAFSFNVSTVPHGFIDYIHFFYSACDRRPILGGAVLSLWLLLLFYLSATTASRFFCPSLNRLSALLRLPPALAGATLLSLANGAPDLFATLVAFNGSGAEQVGLGSALGGALFVSTTVAGAISVTVSSRVSRASFVRDGCFLFATFASLLSILIAGSVGLFGSICFVSLYIAYVIVVSASQCCSEEQDDDFGLDSPLLDSNSIGIEERRRSKLSCLLYVLEMPLSLPRRLTIPVVSEESWSKPFAVASATLSPLLVATLWSSKRGELSSEQGLTNYLIASLVGMVLGILAVETTEKSTPPTKCLLPWLAGGFLMSVLWSYIIAEELVSLLVSLGYILGISPSILGLTVLSWGNSLGDLVSNLAMATSGGRRGAQIAISGCYAGPIFNVLVGLGVSFVLAAFAAHPSPVVIPGDIALFETLGFLAAGVVWALVVLLKRGMRVDGFLGVGLLAIYFCFLCLRLLESTGVLNLQA